MFQLPPALRAVRGCCPYVRLPIKSVRPCEPSGPSVAQWTRGLGRLLRFTDSVFAFLVYTMNTDIFVPHRDVRCQLLYRLLGPYNTTHPTLFGASQRYFSYAIKNLPSDTISIPLTTALAAKLELIA